MDIGEEEKVHKVKPKKVPYEGDEVKPDRRRKRKGNPKKPSRKREKEKVGT